MKDLVLYTWTMLIVTDQSLGYGNRGIIGGGITMGGIVPLSLTTMDALTVMM